MKEYRLKDEKFRKLAQEIARFSVGGSTSLEQLVSMEGSAMRNRLIEYGVFDLWFEEVQEPKFKSGDYIYILDTGNMYEIENCEVMEEELHWNTVGVDKGWQYRFSTYLNNIRHATAEEIEEYKQPLPYINGYKGKRDGEYIVYGCQRIYIEDFKRMYEACMYLNVTAITIAGYQVQKETLQEIHEKIN